jgi:hypothetical protein
MIIAIVDDICADYGMDKLGHSRAPFISLGFLIIFLTIRPHLLGGLSEGHPNFMLEVIDNGLLNLDQLSPAGGNGTPSDVRW